MSEPRSIRHVRRNAGRALLGAALLLGAACEGGNLFSTLPTTGGGDRADAVAPRVQIESPAPGHRAAVGDSLLVRFRLADPQGIRAVELRGFAVRGSASLGTQQLVERFRTKEIVFDSLATVRDTTLARYMLAAADTVPDDSVLIVVQARDGGGNVGGDTVVVSLGGPSVRMLSPLASSEAHAGTPLRVRVAASSRGDRINELVVRTTGAHAAERVLVFDPSVAAFDTLVAVDVPAAAAGALRVQAVVRTISNDTAATASVPLTLIAPSQDRRPPTVTFSVLAPPRAERDDTVSITVSASDSSRVGEVGVSLTPIHRLATRTDTLTRLTLTAPGEQRTFRISLEDLGVPAPRDSSTLRLEVTAFARDTAGNCAAATVAGTALSEACVVNGSRTIAARPGARSEILVVLGTTMALQAESDRIADLASDGSRVYLSNLTRNRLEVLSIGARALGTPISVGSRPWGLAFNPARDTLFVANSGGTNISVVSPGTSSEVRRIQTPNVKLFDVAFEAQRIPDPASTDTTGADSVTALFPTTVRRFDYSDRPQFIGVSQNNNLIYSTRPTGASPDGTVRIYRKAQDRLEIVTEYAEERVAGKVVIANADSAFLVVAKPYNLLRVCPRNRSRTPSLDRTLPTTCFVGPVNQVQDTIRARGYDTDFLYNVDIAEVGLSDTTFVAVSGDHGTVAFGEGDRQNARVMVLEDRLGQPADDPLVKFGEIRDIVGNTAERVIGLALNQDGSLGVARGAEAFYFNRNLRLQGVVGTGTQAGGVDMHPRNDGRGVSYVSGVTSDGLAYVDVIDTFTFRSTGRIFMRDPVTGPLLAVETGAGLKLYAVTAKGVVQIDVP